MTVDTPKKPKQVPSSAHQVIVLLEAVHLTIEDIDTTPCTHELISYHRVTRAVEIRERIQCASIVIAIQSFITDESLGEAPYLKLVITPTVGTNHIDMAECRRRGIKVTKCPGSTSAAVPEHALSLYFAARRKTVTLHNDIRTLDDDGKNSWTKHGSVAFKMQTANIHAPISLEQEVVGIIGYGTIGKRLEALCKGLEMKVLISERKAGASPTRREPEDPNGSSVGPAPHRVPFDEVIRCATVLFLCSTFTEEARHMIDGPELAAMRPEAVIINVSRGGVLNAGAVVRALRGGQISGAAVDVYDREPAGTAEDSAFLAEDTRDMNLTFSPHVGYFSMKTVLTMKAMVKEHIKNFVGGKYDGFVV
ncbi:D-isomer specific 2-hydroxyacid dehydrogenase [Xylariomycetidae sp. FL2044]|nr:D-isomer specific 2-hydroxyacid dehydrogenase [Xylariomycetidae sp. FL2044]